MENPTPLRATELLASLGVIARVRSGLPVIRAGSFLEKALIEPFEFSSSYLRYQERDRGTGFEPATSKS